MKASLLLLTVNPYGLTSSARNTENLSRQGEIQQDSSYQQEAACRTPDGRRISLPHVAYVIAGATYCACAQAGVFSTPELYLACRSVASRGRGSLFHRMVSGYPDPRATDGRGFFFLTLTPTYGRSCVAQGSDGIRLQALPRSGCSSQRGLNGCRRARKLGGKGIDEEEQDLERRAVEGIEFSRQARETVPVLQGSHSRRSGRRGCISQSQSSVGDT